MLSDLGPIRKAGGGGGVQSASGPIRKVGGGGGGGAACRTMIYILVCARVRDSAWGMEGGGGGNWSQRAAFRMNGGGGGGAAAPPPPSPEPVLDPGLGWWCKKQGNKASD